MVAHKVPGPHGRAFYPPASVVFNGSTGNGRGMRVYYCGIFVGVISGERNNWEYTPTKSGPALFHVVMNGATSSSLKDRLRIMGVEAKRQDLPAWQAWRDGLETAYRQKRISQGKAHA